MEPVVVAGSTAGSNALRHCWSVPAVPCSHEGSPWLEKLQPLLSFLKTAGDKAVSKSVSPPSTLRRYTLDGALIVACLMTIFRVHVVLNEKPERPPEVRSQIALGETLDIEDVAWADAPFTVVLFVSQACDVCSESASFFKLLADAVRSRDDTRLIVVTPQTPARIQRWLAEIGLGDAGVQRVAEPSLIGIPLVPALAVVDQDGVVTDVAHGRLSPLEEATIISRMSDRRTIEPFSFRSDVTFISPDALSIMRRTDSVILLDPYTHREDLTGFRPGISRHEAQMVVDCRRGALSKCMSVSNALLNERPRGVFALVNR